MSNVFFTADTHLGHANIIRYCKRPWLQPEDLDENGNWINKHVALIRQREMDRDLISNWNNVVKTSDTVYHLGDFCLGTAEEFKKYKWQLNGNIIFIDGNHDKSMRKAIGKQPQIRTIKVNNQTIILSHFALRVWDGSHFNSWHLFGHSHGTLASQGKSFDVGVDAWQYTPVSFDQVKERMDEQPNNINWISNLPGYNKNEYDVEEEKWTKYQQE